MNRRRKPFLWIGVLSSLFCLSILALFFSPFGTCARAKFLIGNYRMGGKVDPNSEAGRLVQLGPEAVPCLRANIVRKDNGRVDIVVVKALEELDKQVLGEAIVELLKSPQSKVKASVLDAIWIEVSYHRKGIFRSEEIVQLVASLTSDPDEEVRKAASRLSNEFESYDRMHELGVRSKNSTIETINREGTAP